MNLTKTLSHSVIRPIPHTLGQFGASCMGNIYKKKLDDTWECFAVGASSDSKCTILVQDDAMGSTSQLIPKTYRIADLIFGTFVPERFNVCHAVKDIDSDSLVLYNLVDENWHIPNCEDSSIVNTVSTLQADNQLLCNAHDKVIKLTRILKHFEEDFEQYSKILGKIEYSADLEECVRRTIDMLKDTKAKLREGSKYDEPLEGAIQCLQAGLSYASKNDDDSDEFKQICNFSSYKVNCRGVVKDHSGNVISRLVDPETMQVYIPIMAATKEGKPYAWIRYSLDLIMMETFYDAHADEYVAEIFHRDGDKDNFAADNLARYEELKNEYQHAKEKNDNKQLYQLTRGIVENLAYKQDMLSWEIGVLKNKIQNELQPQFIKSCIDYVKVSTQAHNNFDERKD